ncbi:hypothetical protein [Actinomadura roseirufa]|uniref:hypothetical protein n=1 Tax=Actinomadura roseirufa TaxID=2094049 RepID=UPI00104147F5|nr:hypothetical protein [Actinomadura roseirufa]
MTMNIARPSAHWRLVAAAFASGTVAVTVWTVGMAASTASEDRHVEWTVLWSGFDALLAAAMASTAWLVHRRDDRAALTAAVLAALMVVDAWFDVMTARPAHFPVAVAMALALELPLGVIFGVLSVRMSRAFKAAGDP